MKAIRTQARTLAAALGAAVAISACTFAPTGGSIRADGPVPRGMHMAFVADQHTVPLPAQVGRDGGAVSLKVRWPRRTQAIPVDSDVLLFRLFDSEDSEVASAELRRSPGQETATLRIPAEGLLPAGAYTLKAEALAGGTILATGETPLTIRKNRLTAVTLILSPVEVPSPEPTPGPSTQPSTDPSPGPSPSAEGGTPEPFSFDRLRLPARVLLGVPNDEEGEALAPTVLDFALLVPEEAQSFFDQIDWVTLDESIARFDGAGFLVAVATGDTMIKLVRGDQEHFIDVIVMDGGAARVEVR